MKFQKLTIHNIASIEDAVIDFEAQPLADSEVFLITGKTGAGKSTILDAICLALYANTPRLESTMMQGKTKDIDKEMNIDDTRQLMRRNCGEAFVSLTFIGSNDIHYEATWSVGRARNKVTGNMQAKKWQLKNLDTDYTLTKDKEIQTEIHAAIGLDFNQFCRTTMLAQGEFTRFLNSNDNDKADILEKITGVDIYSKIGAKIYEVTEQKRKEWEDAKRLVEGTRTLTDAEITEKQEALSVLDNQYRSIKEGSDKDVSKRDWLKTNNELSKNKIDAADALRTAQETVECEDFKQKELTVKDWNATIDARMWLTEIKKASLDLQQQNRELGKLLDTYKEFLGGLKHAEREVGDIDAEIKAVEAFLSAEAGKVSVYENAQTIVGHLNTIHEGRKAIRKNLTAIESEKKKLTDELIPVLQNAKSETQKAKDSFGKEEESIKTQENAVSTINLPELRAKRDGIKDLLTLIATAKERIETLASAKSQYENMRKKLAERKTALDEKVKTSDAMNSPIREAQIRMEVRKEDLDKQSDTVNKFASTLRLKLQVGDICPVCRQEIKSALPHEEDLAALVSGLKKAYDEAEKEYRKLVEVKLKLDAEIKTGSSSYEHDNKVFLEDSSVSIAEQKALDACRGCGIEKLDDTTLSTLAALEDSTAKTFSTLDARIKDGEKQDSEVKRLRKELEAKRKHVDTIAAKVPVAEKAVNECEGRISTAEALVKSKNGEVSNAEQIASELIVGSWQTDWKVSPDEFASALISSAREYHNMVQQRQTLAAKLETTKANVENVRNVLSNIHSVLPDWKNAESGGVAKVDNLLTKANTLNTNVATVLSKLETAEDSLNTNRAKLNAFLAEHTELKIERLDALNAFTSDDIARESNSLKATHETVVAKKTLYDNAEKQIVEHQTKKPEFAEDETLEALIERIEGIDRQLSEIGEKRGAIIQELKIDQENRERLGAMIEDADKKSTDYQKWSRLNHLIGDSTGKRFRTIAQSYVLTSLIHSANSYMKSLTDRYTLKVSPGTFIITVEDAYQGYVTRAASTISGGESFLVSLSLALALSDIGQTLSVDTLFIDEGFGTLSGEPLQNAINTLRSLHTKAGRHVGIISHVEELQERIPVQIQVNQEGNNSSSKVNVISSK